MWVAPQMALKAASGKAGQQAAGSEDEDEDADVHKQNNDSKILAKYRKAIIDQGFNYFRDEDKLWWIRFFEKQEEILRHHLEPEAWRFEWMWPARCTVPSVAAEEIPLAVPDNLLQKVTGKQTTMYSGRRKATPSFGDYRDLETNTKFAMICVKAQGDPRKKPFWLAKVGEILTKVNGIPDKIKITWYTMDSDDPALEGRYFPEKSKSSNKFLEDELSLLETTVYAYNFCLLANKSLTVATKRIIQAALDDTVRPE